MCVSLSVDNTNSGILAMKTMYTEPDIASDELLQKSKRAASDYNKKTLIIVNFSGILELL